jgi:hypothetical protein
MDAARERLAARQAALVRALTGAGELPGGFDPVRIERAVRSLLNKRRAEVGRTWPALAAALGTSYPERFRAFAARTPPPDRGGPLADGRAFAATLAAAEWTDAARLELLAVELHFCWTGTGLVRRWGFALRWVRLPQSGRLVVRLRLPGGRVLALWGA